METRENRMEPQFIMSKDAFFETEYVLERMPKNTENRAVVMPFVERLHGRDNNIKGIVIGEILLATGMRRSIENEEGALAAGTLSERTLSFLQAASDVGMIPFRSDYMRQMIYIDGVYATTKSKSVRGDILRITIRDAMEKLCTNSFAAVGHVPQVYRQGECEHRDELLEYFWNNAFKEGIIGDNADDAALFQKEGYEIVNGVCLKPLRLYERRKAAKKV